MATLIDLHCHLDLFPDPARVAQEAASRGAYVLSVTTTPTAFAGTASLSPAGSRIRTAIGLHPELAASRQHELPLFEKLLSETLFVGEVGLDGSRPHRTSLDQQAGVFMDILMMCARAGGKIVSIHSRNACARVLDLLSMEPMAGKLILHWFMGSQREIARSAEMDCWFSVGPAMLLNEKGRSAVAAMPRNRVLPETDGPFGTIDNQTIYPWEAMNVANNLANLWRVSATDVSQQLTDNFRRLLESPVQPVNKSIWQTL